MPGTTLIRKTLTAAFVLVLTGLAPAAAVIGFCTRMPCCSHIASDSVAAQDKGADCCTAITCYDAPAAKPATSATVMNNSVASTTLAAGPRLPHFAPVPRAFSDASPPRGIGGRLAILSVLLI
jgi:hypothetical protein